MTKPAANLDLAKTTGQVILEYVLLGLCLCVIALRVTFTEGLGGQSSDQPINLGDQVYSLSVSAVLILSFLCWLVFNVCSRRFLYRFAAVEIGLAVFVIGAIVAGLAAANKRAAITNSATLLAPVLMAVLLVQILDSQAKIKLVLVVIAALGVVSAHQSAEQFFGGNEAMIEQYQRAPETFLEPLGIEPNSFAQMLFEHRLYSRGVRGFFTNSNSAGSFALLASMAAVVLFVDAWGLRKSDSGGYRLFITVTLAAAVVVLGLAITASKGAVGASAVAAVMFVAYLLFGKRLARHKAAVLVACLLLALVCGCVVLTYGVTHGQLPGGNSMLVRWQYWQGAARMYADHPLAGVGPGNFAHFYPNYKPAAALETVADPHNFLLSVLTQFGPIGLVGLLAMVLVPLWTTIFPASLDSPEKSGCSRPSIKGMTVVFLFVVSAVLLFVRPLLVTVPPAATVEEGIAVSVVLYVLPTVAFAAGFLLLTLGRITSRTRIADTAKAALFCAIVGVLIHNLIDFAIFEPGVLTTFWAIVACLIALDSHQESRPQFVFRPAPFVKIIAAAGGLILVWAYFSFALIPVAKATAKTGRAIRQLERAHQLLDQAAEDDRLDPTALSLNGRFYLQHYRETGKRRPVLLRNAAECFLAAIERNPAGYQSFKRLAEAYSLLAKTCARHEKLDCLNRALDAAHSAVERYPGSARLRIELAQIAEQLNKTDVALEHYEKAVEIENSYREQFKVMYPGREVYSRLGEQKYQTAKRQIERLSERQTP